MTLAVLSLSSVIFLFHLHQMSDTRIYTVASELVARHNRSLHDLANSNSNASPTTTIYNRTKHLYEVLEKSLNHFPAEPSQNGDVISKQMYGQGVVDEDDFDPHTTDNGEVVDSSVQVIYRPTTKASSEPSHTDTASNSASHEMGALDVKVVSAEPPKNSSSVLHVPKCKLSNCVDYLTLSERGTLKRCEKLAVQHAVGGQLSTPTCRFMQAEGSHSPVALNSQEGSGNTWLRGLLEKATGICTGFYACDTEMRARGFLGEGIQSAHVLVVKTHVHIPKWKGEKSIPGLVYESVYGSGVFLIRNPARGVIAEWNRLVTLKQKEGKPESHTNVVFKEEFGECVCEWVYSCYYRLN